MTHFSERYAAHLDPPMGVREAGNGTPDEDAIQRLWFSGAFQGAELATADGRPLRVISPGWWNHGGGPDFRGAQIEIAGNLRTGDVEIDLTHANWRLHGHDSNPAFNGVVLHAVWQERLPTAPPTTESGAQLPVLLLPTYAALPEAYDTEQDEALALRGQCAMAVAQHGPERLLALLHLAGEWRMLEKARALQVRMDRMGPDQALYEALLYACGFGPFKRHFLTIAQALHYDRALQLARENPLILEAALLTLAGLMPEPGDTDPRHLERLHDLREKHLGGLRAVQGLSWTRAGLRPINYPERRLGGFARLLGRTSARGLYESIAAIWREEASPTTRRREFEALFPSAMGFWSTHCSWQGKALPKPAAPIGAGRVRSIIGNVFVPAGLAIARQSRDRTAEERVYAFFAKLPREPGNKVLDAMIPRVFGESPPRRMDFRTQQGLLQMHGDWCRPNPSCQRCPVLGYWEDDRTEP